MKKRARGKACSKRHVPQELHTEILCRLPVKSLLRFRCVSKSWLSLISSRDFARLHLNNFKNNRDETHLLVAHSKQRHVLVRRSDTFEADSKRLITLRCTDPKEICLFVSSIDGLVLLKRVSLLRFRYMPFSDLKVWNPSIRKFHEFPPLPRIDTPPPYFHLIVKDIGLGYDPIADDYKHVKLIFENCCSLWESPAPSVAIYSLGTGSWKIIPFQGKGCSWHWVLEGENFGYKNIAFNKGNVCYRGSVHFIAVDSNEHHGRNLVSFDLSSETFSSTGLLPAGMGDDDEFTLIVDGGCSLAACAYKSSYRHPEYSVWTMWVLESSGDGSESECWTKRYLFHLNPKLQLIYIKKDGDLLTRSIHYETVIHEDGNEVVRRWDRVASYNLILRSMRNWQASLI